MNNPSQYHQHPPSRLERTSGFHKASSPRAQSLHTDLEPAAVTQQDILDPTSLIFIGGGKFLHRNTIGRICHNRAGEIPQPSGLHRVPAVGDLDNELILITDQLLNIEHPAREVLTPNLPRTVTLSSVLESMEPVHSTPSRSVAPVIAAGSCPADTPV